MNHSKSICVVTHNCKDGGSVGSVAWHQIIELSKYFEVFVITCGIPAIKKNHIYPILLSPRNWNFLKRFCHVPNEISFQVAARKELIDLCKTRRLSVIWCHSHGTVALTALSVSKRYGQKIIMTTHGDIFERPKGTYDILLTLYYKWATKKAYRYSDHVQALSPYMAFWAINNGAEKKNLSTIPNGIAPEEIGAIKYNHRMAASFLPKDVFRILFVGNLLRIKGTDNLISAMATLKSLKRRSILICVGEGPELGNLQTLVKKYNIEKNVVFVGKIPRNQLHTFYQKADVLAVPSISEPLPTVILEAFAMGLPVVGANTGGIPYILKYGKRGFLFEPGNLKSLTDSLLFASENRDKLASIGHECIFAAANEFSWPHVGKLLRNLIDKTL